MLASPAALGAAAARLRRAAPHAAAAESAGAHASRLATPALPFRGAGGSRAPAVARFAVSGVAAACAADGGGNGSGGEAGSASAPASREKNPSSAVEAAPLIGDDFWRDGGGFPHYLQSRVRALRARARHKPRLVPGPPRLLTSARVPARPAAAAPQKSSETEPCDCTQPVGFEPPADWTCAPYSRPFNRRLVALLSCPRLTRCYAVPCAARRRRATMTPCGRPFAPRRRRTPTLSRC